MLKSFIINIVARTTSDDFKPIFGFYFYGVFSILSVSIISLLIRDKLANSYGIEEIGYFFSAQRIFELIIGLSVSFYSTFYYNRLCHCSSHQAKNMILLASTISFVFFLSIACLLNVMDKQIVTVLLSEHQLPSVEYFPILSINLLLNCLVYCSGFYILSFYRKSRLIVFELVFFIFTVLLVYYFSGKNIVWALPAVTFAKLLLNYFILFKRFSKSEFSHA